jgi:hypothetical protein
MATNYNVVDYNIFRKELAEGQKSGFALLSRSDEKSVRASFPNNPVWLMSTEERRNEFQSLALDGEVLDGFCFPSFNRDYSANNPPVIDEVETGGGGLPGSPYTPNPTSPGVSFAGDADMPLVSNGDDVSKIGDPPEYMADIKTNKPSRPPFNGAMTDTDPMTTSLAIDQATIETLREFMGRSPGRVDDWGSVSGE